MGRPRISISKVKRIEGIIQDEEPNGEEMSRDECFQKTIKILNEYYD